MGETKEGINMKILTKIKKLIIGHTNGYYIGGAITWKNPKEKKTRVK